MSGQYQKKETKLGVVVNEALKRSIERNMKITNTESMQEWLLDAIMNKLQGNIEKYVPKVIDIYQRSPVPCIKCKKPIENSPAKLVGPNEAMCLNCYAQEETDESRVQRRMKMWRDKLDRKALGDDLDKLCNAEEMMRAQAVSLEYRKQWIEFIPFFKKAVNTIPATEQQNKEIWREALQKATTDFERGEELDETVRRLKETPLFKEIICDVKRRKETERIEA